MAVKLRSVDVDLDIMADYLSLHSRERKLMAILSACAGGCQRDPNADQFCWFAHTPHLHPSSGCRNMRKTRSVPPAVRIRPPWSDATAAARALIRGGSLGDDCAI